MKNNNIDSISLKELVDELIKKGKIRNNITRKYIRKILRSDKGKNLEDISLRNAMKEPWEWPRDIKNDVEIKLMELINH